MNKKLSQHEIILKAMLEHPEKEYWKATDFQSGEYFVGYEATARMSEMLSLYFPLIKIGKDGRFRTLSINWEKEEEIKFYKEKLGII